MAWVGAVRIHRIRSVLLIFQPRRHLPVQNYKPCDKQTPKKQLETTDALAWHTGTVLFMRAGGPSAVLAGVNDVQHCSFTRLMSLVCIMIYYYVHTLVIL
jgi:hypothetical protein